MNLEDTGYVEIFESSIQTMYMFQLSPSDADRYWYMGKIMGGVGIGYMLAIVGGFDPIPSSSLDFLLGIILLALVPVVEEMSNSTPLYEELDLDDE
jgi:hypothetical protein